MRVGRRIFVLAFALIGALGVPLTSLPSAAQQGAKLPRVGVILNGGPGPVFDSLRESFRQLGYIEGRNIVFEPRFARGQFDRVPGFAAELTSLEVDVTWQLES